MRLQYDREFLLQIGVQTSGDSKLVKDERCERLPGDWPKQPKVINMIDEFGENLPSIDLSTFSQIPRGQWFERQRIAEKQKKKSTPKKKKKFPHFDPDMNISAVVRHPLFEPRNNQTQSPPPKWSQSGIPNASNENWRSPIMRQKKDTQIQNLHCSKNSTATGDNVKEATQIPKKQHMKAAQYCTKKLDQLGLHTDHTDDLKDRNDLRKRIDRSSNNQHKITNLDSCEEAIKKGVVKQAFSLLNKVTPSNLLSLKPHFQNLNFETQKSRIAPVIDLLVEKAINEPFYSSCYMSLILELTNISFEMSQIVCNFLLLKCQMEVQICGVDKRNIKEFENQLHKNNDKELDLDLERMIFITRRRSISCIKFIGELYNAELLTPELIIGCVQTLLSNPETGSLESACKLLQVIGKNLDQQHCDPYFLKSFWNEKCENIMDQFFQTLEAYSQNDEIVMRVRFSIMDLIELRNNHWTPRSSQEFINSSMNPFVQLNYMF